MKKGLVALTKVDLVEKDWLDLVKEEIREFVKGTFLEGAATVPLSSLTGEGIPILLAEIGRSFWSGEGDKRWRVRSAGCPAAEARWSVFRR